MWGSMEKLLILRPWKPDHKPGDRGQCGCRTPFPVVRSLNQIIEWRCKPLAIRVDTGPEYVGSKMVEWAEIRCIALS